MRRSKPKEPPKPAKDKAPRAPETVELTLEDEGSNSAIRRLGVRGKPVTVGFDPYSREPPKLRGGPKKQPPAKRMDLRRLSEWIKVKNQVAALKDDDSEKD